MSTSQVQPPVATATTATNQQQQLPPHSENVDEELQRIHLALDAVFSPSPVVAAAGAAGVAANAAQQQWWEQRQLADAYLQSFQGTAVAWMVCDRLLQEGDCDPPQSTGGATMTMTTTSAVQQQRRFFAAQTLHMKCRSAIHELPISSLPSLRDSLMNHLQRYCHGNGNSVLTTRLALCISALAVQMAWTTILTDLLEPLAQQQQQQTTITEEEMLKRTVVLVILKVLPEECASDRLLLEDENIRYMMRDHFVACSAMVFSFLHSCLLQESNPERVLMALHIWIRYVPVQPLAIATTPLLEASVQALSQKSYLEVAADVVVEILRMYPSHHPVNEPLVQKLIPLLSKLPLDAALQSDDQDVWKAYCRIVTEMGESYMSLILSSQHHQSSQIVDWVLRCSRIRETEIASITLHFWYRMVMDLEGIDPYEWRQELIDVYTPHLLQLIDICATHLMKFPLDIDDLPDDRVDDLHRDRFYVAETVEDCCRLLGGQVVLHRLGTIFRQECHRVQHQSSSSNPQQSTFAQTEWQGIESCFSCIQCMHRFVPNDEAEVLPFCFALIPQLPSDIGPLRFSASKTIGKYASWLVVHPELMQPLMPYLAQGLQVKLCAPAAAVAIKELCECSNHNMAMGEPVLQLYQEITTHPGQLELNDELQILEGVCRALSRQIQDTQDTGTAVLTRIVQPIGNRLAASVNDAACSPRNVIPEVERLTTVIQHLTLPNSDPNGVHSIVELMKSTWSLLDTATTRFPQDINLAEKICRLHKHALRTCGARGYTPLIDALMEVLVRNYQQSRHSPFLYLASICVAEYGRTPEYAQRLFEMISALATTTFSFLRSIEDFTHHPDVVEEFFYLMGRMISCCPDPLVTSPLLQSLFQCAAVGMQLQHRDANKGTLNFLENTVSYGLKLREQQPANPECQAALEHVLVQEGQNIVTNMARALQGELPTFSNQVPELLWKLNVLCPELLAQWLTNAFSTVVPPERAKTGFLGALNSGLPRDDFNLAVRAFMNACERERKMSRSRLP